MGPGPGPPGIGPWGHWHLPERLLLPPAFFGAASRVGVTTLCTMARPPGGHGLQGPPRWLPCHTHRDPSPCPGPRARPGHQGRPRRAAEAHGHFAVLVGPAARAVRRAHRGVRVRTGCQWGGGVGDRHGGPVAHHWHRLVASGWGPACLAWCLVVDSCEVGRACVTVKWHMILVYERMCEVGVRANWACHFLFFVDFLIDVVFVSSALRSSEHNSHGSQPAGATARPGPLSPTSLCTSASPILCFSGKVRPAGAVQAHNNAGTACSFSSEVGSSPEILRVAAWASPSFVSFVSFVP